MRILLLSLFSTIFVSASFGQTVPAAQTPRPACDGNFTTVRVSTITPSGSIEGFMKALAAHKEWYRSHSLTHDEIFATRIVVRDEKTKAQSYSEKEIVTFHVHPVSSQPEPPHDAAYDAFVKLYRDNSDITEQYNICLPNPSQR